MGESAMMGEAEHSTLEIGEHIKIGGFRGQAHGGGCQSSLAIEAGASETCSGKKMGDGFQAAVVISAATVSIAGGSCSLWH